MSLTDYSPGDDGPTLEQAVPVSFGKPEHDYDGSLTGCADCRKPFGRFQSRNAFVQAGVLRFRHVESCETKK